jgi:hypothetical protein
LARRRTADGKATKDEGLLAPLIGKSIPDLQPAFDEFAAALNKKAESERTPA